MRGDPSGGAKERSGGHGQRSSSLDTVTTSRILTARMKPEENEERAPKKRRSDRDLETFEELPEGQKELQKLKDSAEKASGPKKADLDEKIRRRSSEGSDS